MSIWMCLSLERYLFMSISLSLFLYFYQKFKITDCFCFIQSCTQPFLNCIPSRRSALFIKRSLTMIDYKITFDLIYGKTNDCRRETWNEIDLWEQNCQREANSEKKLHLKTEEIVFLTLNLRWKMRKSFIEINKNV